MSPLWLVLAAVAVWALIRLGRQGERAGRGQWRVTATLFSAVMIGGGALALAKGGWLLGSGLIGAGLWLTLASRHRPLPPRADRHAWVNLPGSPLRMAHSGTVAPRSASSGVRRKCVQASDMARRSDCRGEVPGLQSVATAMGTPSLRNRSTGGFFVSWSA